MFKAGEDEKIVFKKYLTERRKEVFFTEKLRKNF